MTLALAAQAPAFSLPGVDGRTHALRDYADASALVLVQTCNHCPYAQAWEGRIDAIQRAYADRGVSVVAISSNDAETHPEDSFDEMVARAERQRLSFDYLYDEEQSVARALGSERTPEVFLFDADRRLVYHGAVDDNRDETAVTARYLEDALEAVLAGGTPDPADTPPVGCTVKWRS
jgi:peroxiredoxin